MLPVAAQGLIPHSGNMLLLREITQFSGDKAEGKATISRNNPFLKPGGELSESCYIELLAQLAAAGQALESTVVTQQMIRSGYLVGLKDFEMNGRCRAGDDLLLAIKIQLRMAETLVLKGTISKVQSGERVARGQFHVHVAGAVSRQHRDNGPLNEPLINLESMISNCLTVARRSDSTIEATVDLPGKNHGLEGHFPGGVIVPAALMIDACRLAYSNNASIVAIPYAKFSRKVVPGDILKIVLQPSPPITRAQILRDGKECARLELMIHE